MGQFLDKYVCAYCYQLSPTKLRTCQLCKRVGMRTFYCMAHCQLRHWHEEHKYLCAGNKRFRRRKWMLACRKLVLMTSIEEDVPPSEVSPSSSSSSSNSSAPSLVHVHQHGAGRVHRVDRVRRDRVRRVDPLHRLPSIPEEVKVVEYSAGSDAESSD